MKDLSALMQQAQLMQSKLAALEKEMGAIEVLWESGAGLVRVLLNGEGEAKQVRIDPALKDEDWHVLEDLLAAAVNDGVQKLSEARKEKQSSLMGSLAPMFGKLPF